MTRGRPRGRPYPAITEETAERIVALRDAGGTYDQIAAEVGVSRSTVWKTLHSADLTESIAVTEPVIHKVRAMYRSGWHRADIAAEVGVSRSTVDRIVHNTRTQRDPGHALIAQLVDPVPPMPKALCAEPWARDMDWTPDRDDPDTLPIQRAICRRCAHLIECRDWATEAHVPGIYGGTTTGEREAARLNARVTS